MSIPRDNGAHGRPATFSGQNGCIRTVHSDPGGIFKETEGGPSPAPESARRGAFHDDPATEEYTGNPRDQGGTYPAPRANPQPDARMAGTNIQRGRVGKR